MAALLLFAGPDDTCSPSVAELATEARVCTRTVQRALRDLESGGWIATVLRPIAPAMNDTSLYRVLPHGHLLDRERALRARPSSGATARTPSRSISSISPAAPAVLVGDADLGFAGEGLWPEDIEAERVLDQIGPAPQAPPPEQHLSDVPEASVDLEPTSTSPPRSVEGEARAGGGTAKRGAVAPSGTARASATPLRIVGSFLERQGLRNLTGDGFELRLLALARRGGAPLSSLLSAIQAVGERRAERPTSPWVGPTSEARAYAYASIRNELEVVVPPAIPPCAPRRRFHLVDPMQEASLGEPGKKVLALLREQDALSRLAKVEVAHRLARFAVDSAAGGRLTTEDVLHVVRQAAENERDRIAAEGPRADGQLMAFVVGCLQRATPGCARGRGDGGGGEGKTGGGGGRRFEVQTGGVVGDTNEW